MQRAHWIHLTETIDHSCGILGLVTVLQKAHATHTTAFVGFFALLLSWGLRGGKNSGSSVLADAPFAWMLAITAWLLLSLRCPLCRQRVYSDRELLWRTPERCHRYGLEL